MRVIDKKHKVVFNLPFDVIPDSGIGVGTIIKGITKKLGFKPCSGCNKRAESLDRFVIKGK